MKITLHSDVNKYVLTSTLKKEDIDLVKKYRPEALKIKDSEGNDVFAMSYSEGKSGVSKFGITFGGTGKTGYAIVVGNLPATLPAGVSAKDYVADEVGSALAYINKLEASLPEVVAAIKSERNTLVESITEA